MFECCDLVFTHCRDTIGTDREVADNENHHVDASSRHSYQLYLLGYHVNHYLRIQWIDISTRTVCKVNELVCALTTAASFSSHGHLYVYPSRHSEAEIVVMTDLLKRMIVSSRNTDNEPGVLSLARHESVCGVQRLLFWLLVAHAQSPAHVCLLATSTMTRINQTSYPAIDAD